MWRVDCCSGWWIDCKSSLFGHWMRRWPSGYAVINFVHHCYDVCNAFSALRSVVVGYIWINSLSSTLARMTKAVFMRWQLGLTSVCVMYSRATVPGTVNKKCQLQPAMDMLSVLSILMVAIVRARKVLFSASLHWRHAAATLCDVCIFCSSRQLLGKAMTDKFDKRTVVEREWKMLQERLTTQLGSKPDIGGGGWRWWPRTQRVGGSLRLIYSLMVMSCSRP